MENEFIERHFGAKFALFCFGISLGCAGTYFMMEYVASENASMRDGLANKIESQQVEIMALKKQINQTELAHQSALARELETQKLESENQLSFLREQNAKWKQLLEQSRQNNFKLHQDLNAAKREELASRGLNEAAVRLDKKASKIEAEIANLRQKELVAKQAMSKHKTSCSEYKQRKNWHFTSRDECDKYYKLREEAALLGKEIERLSSEILRINETLVRYGTEIVGLATHRH